MHAGGSGVRSNEEERRSKYRMNLIEMNIKQQNAGLTI